jgi:nucleotide-binding universal stress UspA family protein
MKTKKTSKILIAIDFNPTAQKVAEMGHDLAKTMDAETILLHVIPESMNFNSVGHVTVMGYAGYAQTEMGNLQVESAEALKSAANQFLDKTCEHLGDKSIKTVVKEGDLADSILEAAKENHVDFIVLGSHSQKWLENIIMGSVAEKVLRLTTIPLYIIPTKKTNE